MQVRVLPGAPGGSERQAQREYAQQRQLAGRDERQQQQRDELERPGLGVHPQRQRGHCRGQQRQFVLHGVGRAEQACAEEAQGSKGQVVRAAEHLPDDADAGRQAEHEHRGLKGRGPPEPDGQGGGGDGFAEQARIGGDQGGEPG
ncbi:MAG TPA: hypothetical protein VIO94_02840 [Phenylobacterium sp.]